MAIAYLLRSPLGHFYIGEIGPIRIRYISDITDRYCIKCISQKTDNNNDDDVTGMACTGQ